jgi:hypothetical protein
VTLTWVDEGFDKRYNVHLEGYRIDKNYVVYSGDEGFDISPITSEENGNIIIDINDSNNNDPIFIKFNGPINIDISHSAVLDFAKYLVSCE